MHQLFIGFPTVESLIEEFARSGQDSRVFICPLARRDSDGAIGTRTSMLMVQAQLSYGVAYVRIPVGRVTTIHGQVQPQEAADCLHRRLQSMAACVRCWCEREGYRVIEATIARPSDLELMDGGADFLELEQSSDTYSLKTRMEIAP